MRHAILAVALFSLASTTYARLQAGLQRDKIGQERLSQYTSWASDAKTRGRRLSDAYAPQPAPKPYPPYPTYPEHPPFPSWSPGPNSPPNSHVPPIPQTPPIPQIPPTPTWSQTPQSYRPPSPNYIAETPGHAPAPTDAGGCKVLKYATGYANLTLNYDAIVPNTLNFGECCHACQKDTNCQAWTRVAAGEPTNNKNCYLKYSLANLDVRPEAYKHNHEGHTGDNQAYPELRYVNTEWPVVLESGTIPDVYPAEYYGCPYPLDNTGQCNLPANV